MKPDHLESFLSPEYRDNAAACTLEERLGGSLRGGQNWCQFLSAAVCLCCREHAQRHQPGQPAGQPAQHRERPLNMDTAYAALEGLGA